MNANVTLWSSPTSPATLPCESQNAECVILQQEITKESCIKCIIGIASAKWTTVIMCFKFTYLGCCTAMGRPIWNDSRRRRPAKTLDANLIWLWPGHCRHWPVAWPSEIVCAGGGHWTHALWHECSFIWCFRTFYETVTLIVAAVCNRAGQYIFVLWFLLSSSSFFFFFLLSFSSPNLNRRRLDVYHTYTHGVALVRI